MVFFVVPALLAGGLFYALGVGARWASFGLLAVLTPLAGLAAVVGGIWEGTRCDEACGYGSGWTTDMDAWQWASQFWLSVVGLLALLVVVVLTATRSYTVARVAVVVAALIFLAWGFFMAPLTSDF